MSEWTTVALAEIADIRFSNVDKKTVVSEQTVRLCNYMDVYANNYITENLPFMEATATAQEVERFKVEKGDNIITKDSETPDDIGIPAVVIDDIPSLVCGYHLALIKPKREKVDPIYLAKQLGSQNSVSYFARCANGSTRYGLSSSAISSTRIPLAPMVEQRQIGNVLSTLDKAIEKTESLITKYQQIKAGLMHDLFTRGVTPDGKLRTPREQAPELYHETPIGWIPKEWVFGSLATFLSGGPKNGYSPHEIDEWCGCYALGLGCLTSDGFRPVQLKMVDGGVARASDAFLSDGDLLVSRSNTSELVGLCGIYRDVGFPCIYPDLVMRIRPNALVYSEYLEQLLLNSDTRRRLTALAVGTSASMVKLNAKTLLSLSIALPSDLSEQRRILEIVSPSRELIKNLEAERNKLQYEKIGLMQDLLTGRVRVS